MDVIDEIIFATGNRGKLREASEIGERFGVVVVDPESVLQKGQASGPPPEVEEIYNSYAENARAKAEAYHRWCGKAAVGDDSGLEVPALDGQPGLLTARFAGPGASADANMSKLLAALKGQRDRSATFRCVLYLSAADRKLTAEASLVGAIAETPRGAGGFGYDPVFIVEGTGLTLAEIKERGIECKTHRIKAFEELFANLNR
ncbi:MAG: non-canonical purine NTP pyrophosphatase [Deltaproteobacteria bacterium]|nr:non-canonical purine NTP pyrophosphatase [Deltaproteobacteria bacterium]